MLDRTVADGRLDSQVGAAGPPSARPGRQPVDPTPPLWQRHVTHRPSRARRASDDRGARRSAADRRTPAIRPPRDVREIAGCWPRARTGRVRPMPLAHARGSSGAPARADPVANDNQACGQCTRRRGKAGSFAGPIFYGARLTRGHGDRVAGPTGVGIRARRGPAKCLNLPRRHGREDVAGAIPALLLQREEKTCLACHDGAPAAANVLADVQKPFVIPPPTSPAATRAPRSRCRRTSGSRPEPPPRRVRRLPQPARSAADAAAAGGGSIEDTLG